MYKLNILNSLEHYCVSSSDGCQDDYSSDDFETVHKTLYWKPLAVQVELVNESSLPNRSCSGQE